MKKSVVMAAATILAAWTASAQGDPKVGAFLGYDYVRFNSAAGADGFSANGGTAQFILRFNHWLSGVVDAGAVNNGNRNGLSLDTTFANFLAGPRINLAGRHSRFQPYLEVLFGGVYASTSTQVLGNPMAMSVPPFLPIGPGEVTVRLNASQTRFAMMAGGGLDIRLTRHISFRPFGVDYYMTRLRDLRTPGDNVQDNFRYSGGFTFLFGGEKPQASRQMPQPAKQNFSMSLVATPAEVCPGETARLVPSFSGVSPTQLTFSSWFVNGQKVGQTGSYEFQGTTPGTYTVKLMAGGDAFNPASAETTVTVKEYHPPTGTVQASPAEIKAGDKSSISSNFQGQCGGTIKPATYEASEGSIVGDQYDSSTIQWDTANNAEQRKTITITAKASDDRSQGTATTTIDVVRAPVVMPVRLPDVLFPANNSRVNNCGKRILLDQLRSYYERDSSGTVVLVGNSSPDETKPNVASQRAMNAAAVITAGTGACLSIPSAQVQVSVPGTEQNGVSFDSGFCRSSVGPISPETEMRRVQVWFVPSGGQLPASVTNNQAASTLPISNLGCPK